MADVLGSIKTVHGGAERGQAVTAFAPVLFASNEFSWEQNSAVALATAFIREALTPVESNRGRN